MWIARIIARLFKRKPDPYAKVYELLAENKRKSDALGIALENYRKRFK